MVAKWRENTSRSGEVERAGMDAAIRKSPTRYRLSLFQRQRAKKKKKEGRTISNTIEYLSATVSGSMRRDPAHRIAYIILDLMRKEENRRLFV